MTKQPHTWDVCDSYPNDRVLPDENGNCSMCGAEIIDEVIT